MSTPSFRFKRFEVWHDQCAMKVGTDAVLLGAWTMGHLAHDINKENVHVLDIGTGCGVIALMLAQQLEYQNFHIDALDIDKAAIQQAAKNFELSPWASHFSVFHTTFQSFQPLESLQPSLNGAGYSLIVSNPPYFINSLLNPDKGRELARHTSTLSYEDLIQHATSLLAPKGTLALILPAEAEHSITQIAQANGLHINALTRVYSKQGKPCKRLLIAFCLDNTTQVKEDVLYIESTTSARSEQYAALTQNFYL